MKEPTRWRTGMRLGVTALLATAALTAIPATLTPPLRSVAYAEEVVDSASSTETGTYVHSGRFEGSMTYALYMQSDYTFSMHIYGATSMPDYDSSSSKPWVDYLGPRDIGQLKTIYIEDGVTGIGNYAFSDLRGLTTVEIADSVQRIGDNAFAGSTNLANYSLPKNLKYLMAGAFKDAQQLEDLTIPDGIEYIGEKALVAPSRLLKFGDTLPTMPKDSDGKFTAIPGQPAVLDISHVKKTISYDTMLSAHCWQGRFTSFIVGANYEGGVEYLSHTSTAEWSNHIDVGATDVTYELDRMYGTWGPYYVTSVSRPYHDLKAIYSQESSSPAGNDGNGCYRRPSDFYNLNEYALTQQDSLNYWSRDRMTYITWDQYWLLEDYRGDKPKAEWTTPTPPTAEDTFIGWWKERNLTKPVDPDETTGKVYPEYVKKTDLYSFLGGSLRMNETDPAVSTHIRFGYHMIISKYWIEINTSGKTGWKYSWQRIDGSTYSGSLFPDNLKYAYNGNDYNYVTNLVLTNVPVSYYPVKINTTFVLTYSTPMGDEITIESPGEQRSVWGVAEAVKANSSAPEDQVAYCDKILATKNN